MALVLGYDDVSTSSYSTHRDPQGQLKKSLLFFSPGNYLKISVITENILVILHYNSTALSIWKLKSVVSDLLVFNDTPGS